MAVSGLRNDTMEKEVVNGVSPDGVPRSEEKGDQDDIDLVSFGKRPQLKVWRSCFTPGV